MAAKTARRTPTDAHGRAQPESAPEVPGDNSDKSKLNSDDAALIRATLREIMADPASPAAARAQAARTLAEMTGLLGRHAAPPAEKGKPLAEMTLAELEAELRAADGGT